MAQWGHMQCEQAISGLAWQNIEKRLPLGVPRPGCVRDTAPCQICAEVFADNDRASLGGGAFNERAFVGGDRAAELKPW